jgi:hypothetical protein
MFEAMKGRNNLGYERYLSHGSSVALCYAITPRVYRIHRHIYNSCDFRGHNIDAARQQLTAGAPRQFLPKPILQAFYPPCDTWFEFVRGLPYGQWSIEQIEVSHPHQSHSGRDHPQGLTEPYIYYYNDFWRFVNTF